MTKAAKKIVSIMLLIIFPLSAFGVSISSHFCSSKKVHSVSVFNSETSCNIMSHQSSDVDMSNGCSCSDESMIMTQMDHSCCTMNKTVSNADNDCITNEHQNYNHLSLGSSCCSTVSQSYSIIDSFVFSSVFQLHSLDLTNIIFTDVVSDFNIQNLKENTLNTKILDPPILELVNSIIFCIHQSSKSTEDSDSHTISFC